MDIPKMVTINGAARLCKELRVGISRHYIRTLVKRGEIPYVTCGVKVLVNFQGLLDYLSNPPKCQPSYPPGIRPVSSRFAD